MEVQDGEILYSFSYLVKFWGFEYWMLDLFVDKGWLQDTVFRARTDFDTYISWDNIKTFCDSDEYQQFMAELYRKELLAQQLDKYGRRSR